MLVYQRVDPVMSWGLEDTFLFPLRISWPSRCQKQAVLQIAATGGGWPLQLQKRLLQLLQTPCEVGRDKRCFFFSDMGGAVNQQNSFFDGSWELYEL